MRRIPAMGPSGSLSTTDPTGLSRRLPPGRSRGTSSKRPLRGGQCASFRDPYGRNVEFQRLGSRLAVGRHRHEVVPRNRSSDALVLCGDDDICVWVIDVRARMTDTVLGPPGEPPGVSRREAVRRVAWVVLAANLGLAVLKGAVWWDSGSLAVGSEAVNSLADAVYGTVVVAGIYLTTQPPDPEHPHGHERIEPFVSLAVALGIFAAGTLVFRQAVVSLFSGSYTPEIGPTVVGVLVVSILAKLLLYRYALRVGEAHNSPATVATALDNRTDVLTAGAALIGEIGRASCRERV